MGKKLKQLKKKNKELRGQIRQNELRSLSIDQLADSATALAGGSFSLKPLHETVSEAIQQERNGHIQ